MALRYAQLRASTTVAANVQLRYMSLQHSKLVVHDNPAPKPKTDKKELVFGHTFTDHMLQCRWTEADGWDAPVIGPYENLSLPPSAIVFHYAIECFEGMKAFRGDDDKIRLFRPDLNMRRLHKSSVRLSMPPFEKEEFLKCVTDAVVKDKDWIPAGRGYSLYMRPTHIGTQKSLGVGQTNSSLLFMIMSPCGPYYSTGFKPVSLYADPVNVRSWPGGVGDTKGGCNYAPTIAPQKAAAGHGCQQVLWLFGPDHQVTEAGTMNCFMHWINEQGEEELITAPLDGTILEGVTRQSILDMTREWGEFKVTEGTYTMAQMTRAVKEGRVKEVFGAGTAATISPIGEIKYKGESIQIPLELGSSGKLGKRVWDTLFDIQVMESDRCECDHDGSVKTPCLSQGLRAHDVTCYRMILHAIV
eukprot:TRINITY_DN5854_c0_g1_i2.p1 TRINITY_DN5854_c0_g1~~TRINITY_DN5854_c0_g1_i2.p1  ORF type:complete len:414 (+),score=76.41 TRINITY_DN5854_c0_g1_i2:80-1321(+)